MSSGKSSWDCNGGPHCHDECQLRHLDPIEKELRESTDKATISSPSVVVTASRDMGRTASTWVFNAVRLLYRQAKEPCDSYWVRQLSTNAIENRRAADNDQYGAHHVLIKTHEWTPYMSKEEFENIRPHMTHVIVSVRDGFPPDDNWMRYATHIIHFEDIVDPLRVQAALRNLADHLGVSKSLSDADIKQVDYDLINLQTPRHGSDPITKLWFFHGRKGGRKTTVEPEK